VLLTHDHSTQQRIWGESVRVRTLLPTTAPPQQPSPLTHRHTDVAMAPALGTPLCANYHPSPPSVNSSSVEFYSFHTSHAPLARTHHHTTRTPPLLPQHTVSASYRFTQRLDAQQHDPNTAHHQQQPMTMLQSGVQQ
jgi:hypothetical protein